MSSSALGSQSIALLTLPAGTLVDYAGTVEPSGWLLCDGRQLATADYATLFAAIGYSYGGSGANFNIPDFRGRFARYNDNMGTARGAAGNDAGRVHGSTQADAMQGHRHSNPGSYVSQTFDRVGSNTNFANPAATTTAWPNTLDPVTDGSNGSPRTANETRPKNLSCNKLIKI